MQKQIYQLISVQISQENVVIALLKKCKTVDVTAVNAAIGNIQRALQKYVSFEGMDAEFCDEVENLMDKAQIWCLNIEDLCNKTKSTQSILLREMLPMWGFFWTILKLLGLNSLKLQSLPIWDGEIVSRKLTDYITNIYLRRLNLI